MDRCPMPDTNGCPILLAVSGYSEKIFEKPHTTNKIGQPLVSVIGKQFIFAFIFIRHKYFSRFTVLARKSVKAFSSVVAVKI